LAFIPKVGEREAALFGRASCWRDCRRGMRRRR
jgi:hypothetical protein